jgi:tetratricopeptide (TPR) repeat protein
MEPGDVLTRKAETLAEAGYQCLRHGDAAGALKIANELEELQCATAFEIAALAHAQLGDLQAAVAVLRTGLELAPKVWPCWQLLGNVLSDLRRYDDAAAAYEEALGCPDVRAASVRLNQAILASRRGEPDQALMYLDQIPTSDLTLPVGSARVHALVASGQVGEALRIGQALLAQGGSEDPAAMAQLAAAVGSARLAQGATADEILAFALDALEAYERSNLQLLALIRTADGQRSAAAKYFRVTVDARIPSRDPLSQLGGGYIVKYDLVADSVAEALGFVERMEAPAVRGNLRVSDHEVVEDRPDDPKGVYRRSDRFYYPREA